MPNAQRAREIAPEVRLYDLGLDSVAIAMMVFQFEEEFGVDIESTAEDVDVARLRTVSDVYRLARELVHRSTAK